jgi:sigma-B regulation protein RsbQ
MQENYYLWASGFAPFAMANEDSPQFAENFYNTLAAIRPDIALEVSRVIFQSDCRKELSKLKIPTLLIQSRRDMAVPREVALYLWEHIPDSQLAEVDTEGHLPHISKPEEIIKSIKSFIE